MTPADFLTKWLDVLGNERGNHQLFVNDLCELLAVPRPEPWSDDRDNAYTMEFRVERLDLDGASHRNSVDCYRRGHFILEAKAATRKSAKRGTPAHAMRLRDAATQAAGYERAMAAKGEPPVPFLIVADIGGSLELYADFSRARRGYQPFPRPGANRIPLADLAREEVRGLLRAVWTEPYALDPATIAQRVTREAGAQLAGLARALRSPGIERSTIAGFLIRYFFCAFAEDIGLLKRDQFTEFLRRLRPQAAQAHRSLTALWQDLNTGGFSTVLGDTVPQINGGLFKEATALPLTAQQLELLIRTAEMRWDEVEPAIFGTLLEQALDERERHSLGAHFTPRAYVELLVDATVLVPLRAEWAEVRQLVARLLPADDEGGGASAASRAAQQGAATKAAQDLIVRFTGADKADAKHAQRRQGTRKERPQTVEEHALGLAHRLLDVFHRRLSAVRVLDPACGTGNFLYVALDLLKRLEAEVTALERDLGFAVARVDDLGINPRNFLGLELNPEAVPVAELVLWIGWLQWYRRTRPAVDTTWPTPVLHDYQQIRSQDALITYDRSEATGETRWDGFTTVASPTTGEQVPDPTARTPVFRYHGAMKTAWPEADFIVGNPPFIGAGAMRAALGDGYVEAVRAAWSDVPESADFVMYWWHHAARLLARGEIRRFGFITTKAISQTFNRRIVQEALGDGLGIAWTVPNHPWVDTAGGAAVRIAMTVAARTADIPTGTVLLVAGETASGSDLPVVTYAAPYHGRINADLTIGADVTETVPLKANDGLACPGMKLHGAGFIVDPATAAALGLGQVTGMESVIRPYRNGRDLTASGRGVLVIDAFGFTATTLAERFPTVYQHLVDHVKPERMAKAESPDGRQYAQQWWLFGKTRQELRRALSDLPRYIATVETTKHRIFQFLSADICPDNMLIAIASDDALHHGILSSRIHAAWSLALGGRLGVGDDPRYNKSRCFDPFPFPLPSAAQAARIRDLAEQLDAHRKHQQAAHPALTLTGMYNVLAKLRTGEALSAKEQVIHADGVVAVLRQLHDDLDAAVAAAYDWPVDLPDAELLTRLVALNAKRAAEEKAGTVRWLRPAFQAPDEMRAAKRAWPKPIADRLAALREELATAGDAGVAGEALRKRFTGARAADMAELLAALAAMGHARTHEGRWFQRET